MQRKWEWKKNKVKLGERPRSSRRSRRRSRRRDSAGIVKRRMVFNSEVGATRHEMYDGNGEHVFDSFDFPKESSSNPYDRDVLAAFDAHVIRSVFTPRQEESQPVMMTPRAPSAHGGASEILACRSPTGDHRQRMRERRRPFGSGPGGDTKWMPASPRLLQQRKGGRCTV